MLEWALNLGFPGCVVLADSWYGIGPFVKELTRLKLRYVLEVRSSYSVRRACRTPKLTPTGRLAKKQYDVITLPTFFKSISTVTHCGFSRDIEPGQEAKVLYDLKIATVRLNAIPGKHRTVF